ncbi:MAG TPA: TRAP transporter large permease, partial [Thermodesulfobacteriota bacterium]|nr:TRAP transporter large permease [Thermodesulfobacteriota bacterium]
MIAILIFGTFGLLLIVGLPIALALGVTSLIILLSQDVPLVVIAQRMFAGTDSFPLVAVPFFILAGDLLARGKISDRLVNFAESFLGFLRGGLWIVSVVAAMFFAGVTGSGAADTAAIASPLFPELKKRKYREDFSAAIIASAGIIGVVIPPSVPMVLYCCIADQSIGRLFMNGFIPGVLMGLALIAVSLQEAHKNRYPKGAPLSLRNIWRTFKTAILGLLTPLIILGGIFSGYFTPSEAAAVAFDWAIIVSIFVYREIGWREFSETIIKSAVTSAIVMFIIATANIFGWILANWKVPNTIAAAVLTISQDKYIILLLINIIIFIAGCVMETASALIILTPIF